MMKYITIFLASVAFTLAAEPISEAQVKSDGKIQVDKPRQPLEPLDEATFLDSIDSHEISVVAFFTKHAPQWPLVRAILEVTAANFSASFPTRDVSWVSVHLDDNPRLSTYSHFNMIDVMFMFPKYALFPIRVQHNLSVTSMLAETEEMWQYTSSGLSNWDDIEAIKNDWTDAYLKGKGSQTAVSSRVDVYERRMKAYTGLLKRLGEDQAVLALESNQAKSTLLKWESRNDDPQVFLEGKEKLFMLEQFLQYAFDPGQIRARKLAEERKKSSKSKKAQARKPAPSATSHEELF